MRIAILTPYDEVLAFMDADLPQAMHFYDDCLHTYRFGLAYTFDFRVLTSHPDSRHLKEGNKLAFIYEDVSYYLTIIQIIRNAKETSVTAQSMTLELLNEEVDVVDSPQVKSAAQYINDLGFESDVMVIGSNEVADQKRRLKFDSKETIISRLYAIAAAFDAEAEFQVHLKQNYALDRIDLNLKKAGTLKGVGADRTASVIRQGNEIQGIEKETDISALVTGIRARGKKAKSKVSVEKTEGSLNGRVVRITTKTTLEEDKRKEIRTVTLIRDPQGKLPNFEKVHIRVEYEEDGKISTTERELTNGQKEPFIPTQLSEKKTSTTEAEATEKTMTLMGFGISSVSDENGLYILDAGGDLRAPDSRNRYPSSLKKGSDGLTFKDGYIFRYFEDTSAETQLELFEGALKELKDGCIPKIKYTIKGYVQGNVGDWLMVEDAQYDPPMYVRCRIMEQEKSLIRPYEGTTTVDNFTEFASRIDTGYRQTLVVPTISQQQNPDGSLTIITESAGISESSILKKGEDGFSPSVDLSKSGKISTLTITDKDGSHTTQIHDGEDGQAGPAGFSPTATVSKSGKTATILIMDKSGTTSVKVNDGADGQAGDPGTGISSVVVKHYQSYSSSAPTQNSTSWSTSLPTSPVAGYYLHTQIAITMTDGTTKYFYLKTRNGSNGTSPTVVNSLTSTSTSSALSAYQGKVLADRVSTLESSGGGGSASGVVINLQGTDRYDTTKAQAVVAGLRNGVTPMIYSGVTYAPVVATRLEDSCGVYYLTMYYYDVTCGYPNLTSVQMQCPETC